MYSMTSFLSQTWLPLVITSTPSSRMVSAMSPVTPKPAAEFSTLAITRSIARVATRAGIARRAISRPGFPKMSPTNRTFMRLSSGHGDGNANLRAAAFVDARHHDVQFAGAERCTRAAGVEGACQAKHAREAAEFPLREVERDFALLTGAWKLQ